VTLEPLSEDQHRFLRFYRQLEDPRAYDPSRNWYEQRVSPYVLLLPVTDQVKDGLARIAERRYTVQTVLGKPPAVLTYNGAPVEIPNFHEHILHDLLLSAIRRLLDHLGNQSGAPD
jgi:hypothetical protein